MPSWRKGFQYGVILGLVVGVVFGWMMAAALDSPGAGLAVGLGIGGLAVLAVFLLLAARHHKRQE